MRRFVLVLLACCTPRPTPFEQTMRRQAAEDDAAARQREDDRKAGRVYVDPPSAPERVDCDGFDFGCAVGAMNRDPVLACQCAQRRAACRGEPIPQCSITRTVCARKRHGIVECVTVGP